MPSKLVVCPRCGGDGEEPGAPYDLEDGTPLCTLCKGNGEVTEWKEDDPHGVDCAIRVTSTAECTCGKLDYLAEVSN